MQCNSQDGDTVRPIIIPVDTGQHRQRLSRAAKVTPAKCVRWTPSPSLEVGPLKFSKGVWERCGLPQQVLGRSPSENQIWRIVALKSGSWWHQFYQYFGQSIRVTTTCWTKLTRNWDKIKMREIIFKRAEMRELSENAWDSREMRETWQVWLRLVKINKKVKPKA